MTAREQAIEAAHKALWNDALSQGQYAPASVVTRRQAAVALAAAVPVLLNDLADEIRGCFGVLEASDLVRAVAEGQA